VIIIFQIKLLKKLYFLNNFAYRETALQLPLVVRAPPVQKHWFREPSARLHHFRLRIENFQVLNSVAQNVGECLLSFGAESFVFQVAIQKHKD
jgi:hypothetical protein